MKHQLVVNQALPLKSEEDAVQRVLFAAKELLFEMSGKAKDIRYRHFVREKDTTIGGPLGQAIRVIYITVVCQFEQAEFWLPQATKNLIRKFEQDKLAGLVGEHAVKAREAKLAAEAKAAKEAAKQPNIRDLPGVETVPAKDVPLSKMLVSDAELLRASDAAGVTVFDGPMFPTSPDEVQ
jgi:hypothetical protein